MRDNPIGGLRRAERLDCEQVADDGDQISRWHGVDDVYVEMAKVGRLCPAE